MTRIHLTILFLASSFLMGCDKGKVPPIDQAAPTQTETASFALG